MFPNIIKRFRKSYGVYLKIKQIPLPQPKPTKLKLPRAETWYSIFKTSCPADSFQAILGSATPEVLAKTKVKKIKV